MVGIGLGKAEVTELDPNCSLVEAESLEVTVVLQFFCLFETEGVAEVVGRVGAAGVVWLAF